MKTFVATFAAILCAAAVIWAVQSSAANLSAEKAINRQRLEAMVKQAELAALRAEQQSRVDDKDSFLPSPAEFASLLKNPLPTAAEADALRRRFATAYHDATDAVRKNSNDIAKKLGALGEPDKETLAWLDEMDRKLAAAIP